MPVHHTRSSTAYTHSDEEGLEPSLRGGTNGPCRLDVHGHASATEAKLEKRKAAMMVIPENVKARKRSMTSGVLGMQSIVAGRFAKIQPKIIQTIEASVRHVDPSDFMQVVQSLTGSQETRHRWKVQEDEPKATNTSAAVSPRSSTHLPSPSSPSSTTSAGYTLSPSSAQSPSLCAVGSPCGSDNSTSAVGQTMHPYIPDLPECLLNGRKAKTFRLEDCDTTATISASAEMYDRHTDEFAEQKDLHPCSFRHSDELEPCLADFQKGFYPSTSSEADADSYVSSINGQCGALFMPGYSSPQEHEDFGLSFSGFPLALQISEETEDSYLQQLLCFSDRDFFCTFNASLL
ncbi:hypothetical protein KP509_22G013300 [Ceratopteris richardii]|uniref:VQ domain-containing protein n=1 Tax=Ceratopteris richardii TaxID=49495 RepID=A0A8T2S2R3_CERRI|nr:hypothetical protein KP509_22G013300 [Ceratopteris richardii]